MRAVNLLPRETLAPREPRRIDPLLVVGAVLVLAVAAAVGGGFVLERSHARSEQRQLAAVQAQVAQAQAEQPKPGTTQQLLSQPVALTQEQSWQLAIEGVLSTRVPWDRTLAKLARVVPAGVSLGSLSLGSSQPGVPGTVSITGKALSKLAVVQLFSRLTLLPELEQVKLGPVTVNPSGSGGGGKVSFSISAQVKGPSIASLPASALTTGTTTTSSGGSS